ncbi:MAG TPA: phosphatase PAP2 family protein [Rhizomicrobium sp.]|nr:phosphatase PAP2 family protein [Rhizomicrobium sp.]
MAGALGALLFCAAAVSAAEDDGWINRVDVERIVPPPPAQGSRIEQNEIAEIYRVQAAAAPAAKELAGRDNDIENPSIFKDVIGSGWDMSKLPKTRFLMGEIGKVDRIESGKAKKIFHRPRPWMADPKIQTCAPHPDGPQLNSYPSGHAMLGYEIGVVIAALIPEKSQAILARAKLYGENRILCGFHFRSDVTAGEKFGTVLAEAMLKQPRFHAAFLEARSELIAAGLTH